jgi:uncharacterized protein (DUF1800 family)
MTTNPRLEAALALHRFGFGPVAGSIAAIADDPCGALLADLERPGAGRVAAANLPNAGRRRVPSSSSALNGKRRKSWLSVRRRRRRRRAWLSARPTTLR